MSVQSGPTFKRYAANGVTTVYAIPFLLLDAADLLVTLDGVEVVSGFVLTGVGNPSSTCTFSAAPTGDLLFQLSIPFQRLADYQENGDLLSGTLNNDLDRLWLAIKQLSGGNDRALSTGVLEPEGIPALPVAAVRALKLLAFDALSNPVASTLTLSELEQQPALALASAQSASASAAIASVAESNSSASAALANQWATEAEDTPVTAGLYSAYHWARKALASATAAAATLANAVLKTGAQTMAGPLTVTNGITSIPFNKEYVSAEQTIVANGPLTLAHGLGVIPKFMTRTLVCKVAEHGYSIGDTVDFPATQDAGASYGLTIVPDSTNLNCRYGSVANAVMVYNKTTGAPVGITLANWRLIVRAWA